MRHSRSFVAATLMLAGSLAGVGAVLAADPPGSAPPAMQEGQQRWAAGFQQRLGLTDDQMAQLKQAWQANAPTYRQHAQAVRQARKELRQLVLDNASQADIEAKQMQLQQLYAQGVELHVQRLKTLSSVLTPEQRAKFAQMADRPHRFHRGGHRGPHGAQPQSQG
jgi:Spy/CpxP family protein refolding chaperone